MSASLNITALLPAHLSRRRRRAAHESPAPNAMCWCLERASSLAPGLFAAILCHCRNVRLVSTEVRSEAIWGCVFINITPHSDHLLVNLGQNPIFSFFECIWVKKKS